MAAIDFGRLKAWLTASKLNTTNNSLYQTIFALITNSQQLSNDTNKRLDAIDVILGGGGGSSGISGAPILTHDIVNTAVLSNYRELLAGDNIEFDDTTAYERTISAQDSLHPFLLMGA